MNRIEEELWNYIDGSCTEQERLRLAQLIESDASYRQKYDELLRFNESLSALRPDEPPMGFSFRVMEHIREDRAPQRLHAHINRKLVYGIGSFFIVSILLLLAVAVFQIKLTPWASGVSARVPHYLYAMLTGRLTKAICFLDAILMLVLLDAGLRRSRGRQVDYQN